VVCLHFPLGFVDFVPLTVQRETVCVGLKPAEGKCDKHRLIKEHVKCQEGIVRSVKIDAECLCWLPSVL
jgi:hypothetical protein